MNGIRDHKKMLCIFLSLVCCLTLFIVPSFADSSYTFDNQPIPIIDSLSASNIVNSGLAYGFRNGYSNFVACYGITNNVYIANLNNSSTSNLLFVSDSEFDYTGIYVSQSGWGQYVNPRNASTYFDNVTSLYYLNTYTYDISTDEFIVPSYSNIDDCLADVRTFIDNGGGSSDLPTLTYSFDIPNGWYYVFSQVDPSEEVTITATFAQNSTLFSNTWSPNTMYWDRQTGSTPSVYNPMPNTQNQSPLVLSVTGDTNIMGQGKNGVTTLTQGSGTFLGIYNPTYRSVNSQNTSQYLQNPTLHVSCPSGFNYVVADSLKETLTEGGITSSVVHSDSKVLVSGVDENGNPVVGWKEPDGTTDTDAPVTGGSNQLPEQFSVSDYLQQVRESLDNFANNFIGLLKSPISHVRQLISAGTEYFGVIRGLYAWLPENVQNTLESAMIVSLSIGVIGLLL